MPKPTAYLEQYYFPNNMCSRGLSKIQIRGWTDGRHLDLDNELDATGFPHNPSPNPSAGSGVVVVDPKRVLI